MDFIVRILEELDNSNIRTIQLSGGEPFLHPNIWEIIQFILDKGFRLEVYSSGTIMSGSIPLTKLRRIHGKERLSIRFNLQGPTASIHNTLVGNPDAFENVIQSIYNTNAAGILTEIHFLPVRPNYMKIKELISKCYSINVSKIKILRFVPQGRGHFHRNLELGENEFEELRRMIKDSIIEHKVEYDIGKSFKITDEGSCKSCQAGVNKFVIDYNRNLYPCAGFKQDRRFLIKDIKSFSEALISSKYNDLMQKIKKLLRTSNKASKFIGGCPCQFKFHRSCEK